MKGEKFLEKKVEGNKIIRISEFKDFNYDFLELIQDLNDNITDDWEALQDRNINFDRNEDFYSFDVDNVLDWIGEIIEEEEELEDLQYLKKWIKPLEEAKGFTIYLK